MFKRIHLREDVVTPIWINTEHIAMVKGNKSNGCDVYLINGMLFRIIESPALFECKAEVIEA